MKRYQFKVPEEPSPEEETQEEEEEVSTTVVLKEAVREEQEARAAFPRVVLTQTKCGFHI